MNSNSRNQKRPRLERELHEFLIDDALARSTKLRRIGKRIRRAQQVLRGLCSDPAWEAYLKIEEATNARAGKELRLVLTKCLEVFGYAIFESRRLRPP
jgi:hypothetical protein